MAGDTRLGGRPRKRIAAIVRARHLPCPLCGYPINQQLPRTGRRHPLSSVVDEWVPRNPCSNRCRRGCATNVPPGEVSEANCTDMHDRCNTIKSNHWPVTAELKARCRTEIEQLLGLAEPVLDVDRTW